MQTTTTISIRLPLADKQNFERFCENVGMNVTTAVNMFVKVVLREQKLPFEIKSDPFWSVENQAHLMAAPERMNNGQGKEHELIDA